MQDRKKGQSSLRLHACRTARKQCDLGKCQRRALRLRAGFRKSGRREKRLKEETHLYIIELATLLAEKYIMEKLDDEAQNRLLEEAIAQLEEAEWKH